MSNDDVKQQLQEILECYQLRLRKWKRAAFILLAINILLLGTLICFTAFKSAAWRHHFHVWGMFLFVPFVSGGLSAFHGRIAMKIEKEVSAVLQSAYGSSVMKIILVQASAYWDGSTYDDDYQVLAEDKISAPSVARPTVAVDLRTNDLAQAIVILISKLEIVQNFAKNYS